MSRSNDSSSCHGSGERIPLLLSRGIFVKFWHFAKLRRIKTKGASLILFQYFLASVSALTYMWSLTEINDEKNKHGLKFSTGIYGSGAAVVLLIAVACPIVGWMTDVHYSRYKVIQIGLRLMWLGSIVAVIWCLLLNHWNGALRNKKTFAVVLKGGGLVWIVMVVIGYAMFAVNAVQFSVDQIPEASGDELTTLIHWLVWATFAGELLALFPRLIKYCVPGFNDESYLAAAVQFLIPAAALTLAIACDFIFRGWLTREPDNQNPLRTVMQVLKFSLIHKYPISHHATIYWVDEKPSRIDFAKQKYGGPFTTEQVEDVKTFFRIMLVLLAVTTAVTPLELFIITMMYLTAPSTDTQCRPMGIQDTHSIALFAVVLIPLYEFVLYPFIRNRLPSTLVRVRTTAVLTVILAALLLVVDSVKHARDPHTACMFQDSSSAVNPRMWLRVTSSFLTVIAAFIYGTSIVEFTYAQSPYNMRGFLAGLMLSVWLLTISITFGVFVAWNRFRQPISPSCDFYYLTFQFLCAVAGLVVLCVMARWYKWRRREEDRCGLFLQQANE